MSNSPTYAVIVVRDLEPGEAEAVVGAHGVLAGAIPTGLPVALIDVCRAERELGDFRRPTINPKMSLG